MTESVLVGRNDELTMLAGHLDRAIQGSASICMVTGEPGAGKSSLLTRLVTDSLARHPQLLVATGECNALGETGDPYLPFREVLQDLTGENADLATVTASSESRFRSFFRHSAQVIAEHGPDLVDIFVPGAALAARIGGKAAKRFGLDSVRSEKDRIEPQAISQDNIFEQYVQVLRAIATERPLLLILDDLHWADSGTAGLLFHLARRLASDPILLVGAYRSQEVRRGKPDGPHTLSPILSELQRIHGDIVIDLDDQNPTAFTNALLDATPNSLDATFRSELVLHTGGNPLFVVELLHNLEDSGVLERNSDGLLQLTGAVDWSTMPSRVEGVVQGRLQQTSARQREILDVACVQGTEFSAELTARIVEVTKRKVITELSGPLQRDLGVVVAAGFESVGSRTEAIYRFRHNLFQNYLYEKLDEIERASIHEQTGAELEALFHGEEDVVAVSLAHHYAQTPQWRKTLHYSVMAGDRARSALAPREAVTFYRNALQIIDEHGAGTEETPGADAIAERLGDQAELLGEHEDAIAAYDRAIAAMADGSDLHRARVLTRLAVPLQRLKRYDKVEAVLCEAEGIINASPAGADCEGRQAWLDIYLERAYMYYWTGDTESLASANEAIVPIMDNWGTGTQKETFAASRMRLGLRQSRYRPDKALIAVARQAMDDLDDNATELSRMHACFQYGFALMNYGDFERAVGAFEQAIESYQRCGDLVLKVRAIVYLSVVRRRLQQDDAVRGLLDEAESLVAQIGASDYDALLTAQRAWLAYRDQELDLADRLSSKALAIWQEAAPGFPFKWAALWIQIAICADRGDCARALEFGQELIDPPQMRQPPELENALSEILDGHGDRRQLEVILEMADAAGMI